MQKRFFIFVFLLVITSIQKSLAVTLTQKDLDKKLADATAAGHSAGFAAGVASVSAPHPKKVAKAAFENLRTRLGYDDKAVVPKFSDLFPKADADLLHAVGDGKEITAATRHTLFHLRELQRAVGDTTSTNFQELMTQVKKKLDDALTKIATDAKLTAAFLKNPTPHKTLTTDLDRFQAFMDAPSYKRHRNVIRAFEVTAEAASDEDDKAAILGAGGAAAIMYEFYVLGMPHLVDMLTAGMAMPSMADMLVFKAVPDDTKIDHKADLHMTTMELDDFRLNHFTHDGKGAVDNDTIKAKVFDVMQDRVDAALGVNKNILEVLYYLEEIRIRFRVMVPTFTFANTFDAIDWKNPTKQAILHAFAAEFGVTDVVVDLADLASRVDELLS